MKPGDREQPRQQASGANGMAFAEKYTPGEVAAALLKAGGVINTAATELGCQRRTLVKFLERHPDLERVREYAVDETIDLAESKLIKKIKQGNLGAIIFYLKTKGRDRGYVERAELRVHAPPVQVYLPEPDPQDGPPVIDAQADPAQLPQASGE